MCAPSLVRGILTCDCCTFRVQNVDSLSTDRPTATWRKLLSPVSIGRERGPACPTRLYGAGAMHLIGEDLVWYGGCGPSSIQATPWAYSTRTHKWRELELYSAAPAKVFRFQHSSVYDPITGIWLLAGGMDNRRLVQLTASMVNTKTIGQA
jgi:hypothetical protein